MTWWKINESAASFKTLLSSVDVNAFYRTGAGPTTQRRPPVYHTFSPPATTATINRSPPTVGGQMTRETSMCKINEHPFSVAHSSLSLSLYVFHTRTHTTHAYYTPTLLTDLFLNCSSGEPLRAHFPNIAYTVYRYPLYLLRAGGWTRNFRRPTRKYIIENNCVDSLVVVFHTIHHVLVTETRATNELVDGSTLGKKKYQNKRAKNKITVFFLIDCRRVDQSSV